MVLGDSEPTSSPTDALSELQHLLRSRFGWEPSGGDVEESLVRWRHPDSDELIFLPRIAKRDIWLHLNESLAVLSRQSGTSRSDLDWLIRYATHDRLTSRIAGVSAISYREEVVRRKALGDLLEFAARAQIKRNRLFGSGGKPAEVSEYIESVLATPTVSGSYVYRVLLPNGDPDQEHLDPSENMYRQFNVTAAASIGAAIKTASAVEDGGALLEAWDETVEAGVSANLCDALATHVGGPDLGAGAGESHQVDLQFHYWSTRVPTDSRTFQVSSTLAAGIEGGAAYLRGESEGLTIEIEGEVSTLSDHQTVTVQGTEIGVEEKKTRRYSFDVDLGSHDELAEAYRTGAKVKVTLDVTRAPTGRIENVAMRSYEVRGSRADDDDEE